MTLIEQSPKSIKLGTTDIKKVYLGSTLVRPKPRTFTISWTEQSNMSSGWTYSDDAAGLTAGDSAFDEFFGYSGVRLNTSGQETAEITQAASGGAGKLDITQLGTLTSGDNVMIKFPVRGIKMSKSGSVVTLSITDEPNKAGYQYYAHCTGTLSSPGTPKNAFYLGAYKGYNNSNVLKSWSGQTPTSNIILSNFCTYAKANGSGYNTIGFYQRQYINALYMMKYGNPNSQSVVGQGYVGLSYSSSQTTTGGTNSQTNATYGTSSNTTQIKLFGLEDRWGNLAEMTGGAYTDSNNQLCTMLTGWNGAVSGGEGTGTTLDNSVSTCISSIAGNNKAMFSIVGGVDNSDYNTYYTDIGYARGERLPHLGGSWYAGNSGGVFFSQFSYGSTATAKLFGTRLMYLNGLT